MKQRLGFLFVLLNQSNLRYLRRPHLLVLGGDEHGRDADELQLPAQHGLQREVPVDDVHGEVEGLRHQLEFVVHIDDPVCQDGPHLGIDLHLGVDVITRAALVLQQGQERLHLSVTKHIQHLRRHRRRIKQRERLSYLSDLVELVDILNIVHHSQLIVTVELVNVLNHFSRFVSDSTGNLALAWSKYRLRT